MYYRPPWFYDPWIIPCNRSPSMSKSWKNHVGTVSSGLKIVRMDMPTSCGLSISSCRSIRAGVHWKNTNTSFFFSTVTIDLERPTDFHQNEGKNMDWSSVALIGASVKVEALIAAQFRSRKREFEFSSRFIGSLDSEFGRFTLFLSLFFLYICLYGTADHYLSAWIGPSAPRCPRHKHRSQLIWETWKPNPLWWST